VGARWRFGEECVDSLLDGGVLGYTDRPGAFGASWNGGICMSRRACESLDWGSRISRPHAPAWECRRGGRTALVVLELVALFLLALPNGALAKVGLNLE